jgi:hypothetical protein
MGSTSLYLGVSLAEGRCISYHESVHEGKTSWAALVNAPARLTVRAGAGGREHMMKPGKAAARPTFPGLVSREDISGVGAIELVSTSLRCGMLQQALSRGSAA